MFGLIESEEAARKALIRGIYAKFHKNSRSKEGGEHGVMIPNRTMKTATSAVGAPDLTATKSTFWYGGLETLDTKVLLALSAVLKARVGKKHLAFLQKHLGEAITEMERTDLEKCLADLRSKVIRGSKPTRNRRMRGYLKTLRGGVAASGQSQTALNPIPRVQRDKEDQPVAETEENNMGLSDAIGRFRGVSEAKKAKTPGDPGTDKAQSKINKALWKKWEKDPEKKKKYTGDKPMPSHTEDEGRIDFDNVPVKSIFTEQAEIDSSNNARDLAFAKAMLLDRVGLHESVHRQLREDEGCAVEEDVAGEAGVLRSDEDNRMAAELLGEGKKKKKKKLHPSMLKHVNAPKFKAHIGDPDDSEPPYYKGKGIQKEGRESDYDYWMRASGHAPENPDDYSMQPRRGRKKAKKEPKVGTVKKIGGKRYVKQVGGWVKVEGIQSDVSRFRGAYPGPQLRTEGRTEARRFSAESAKDFSMSTGALAGDRGGSDDGSSSVLAEDVDSRDRGFDPTKLKYPKELLGK